MQEELIRKVILEKADAKLNEIADFILSKSQENIVQRGISNEGMLLKSGYVNRKPLEKEIGYSAPYAAFVEFGTDPHMPPVAPISKWARKKLGLSEKEARSAAWAIAKKISSEGTEPQPFFRDAIGQAKAKYSGVGLNEA